MTGFCRRMMLYPVVIGELAKMSSLLRISTEIGQLGLAFNYTPSGFVEQVAKCGDDAVERESAGVLLLKSTSMK